jgi:solute carrier family 45, member 1/2/4
MFLLGDLTKQLVQAIDRVLLVDTLPRAEQAKGNAWAAIMLGIGSVAGFFL